MSSASPDAIDSPTTQPADVGARVTGVPTPRGGYLSDTGEEDEMTTDPRYTPIAMTGTGKLIDDDGDTGTELVGADDAAADAVRAGADIDLAAAERDTDPTPVGAADAEADRRRAAGED
ncbi:hypothetical protein ACIBQ2_05515 [Micromonospora sediminimaris]|uniref:hypothetical protein n=1 Tax=Micromonospora sediminimaris TaxID=547162 RepID=UPI001E3F146A|nr:hypothetical protein [Micromonospora sediminimaris]